MTYIEWERLLSMFEKALEAENMNKGVRAQLIQRAKERLCISQIIFKGV